MNELSVGLEGIELRGHCGVSSEERAVGQRLVVDVWLSPRAATATASDDLADTVDYGLVASVVERVVGAAEYRLIERLAAVIADELLATLPIDEVKVTVRKPTPPVSVPVAAARVEVARRR